MTGTPIRQDYLETAIDWVSEGHIEEYMAKHQHDPNAGELWHYFQSVIAWATATFPKKRKEMKGVAWGPLENQFKGQTLNGADLEKRVAALMRDDEVTKKSGIYPFVLDVQERHLSLRNFTDNQKREAYETQNGVCPACGRTFEFAQMEADHVTPWHAGGKTIAANCKMLCKDDNRKKSGV